MRTQAIVPVLAAGLTAVACDEKLSTVAGPTPNLTPTFASIQTEIFQTTDSAGRSACTRCHSSTGRTPSGGLNLNPDVAYDQLVNVPGRLAGSIRVIPGDPDNSYLIKKLEGTQPILGNRMPNNGPPYLTDGQILFVRRWIANGAPR